MAKRSVPPRAPQRRAQPAPDPKRVQLALIKRAKRLHAELGREARGLLVAQQRADRDVLAVIRELARIGGYELVNKSRFDEIVGHNVELTQRVNEQAERLRTLEREPTPAGVGQ